MSGNRATTSRRSFLKASAAVGGGLVLGLRLPTGGRYAEAADMPPGQGDFEPNAWIRISSDDQVTIIVGRSEMGQGVLTAMPMLVAEELEADWTRLTTEFAPADRAYTNPLLGRQATGGSTAVRGAWRPLREAGATARAMLLAAAAERWGVRPEACRAENQVVRHPESGRRATYGELAEAAAGQQVPEAVFLKEPGQFRLLGKPTDRLDAPEKVDGSAVYGMDVTLPGLLTAQVARCPVIGGRPGRFDAEAARRVPGVRDVFEIESGVAVVAEGFWPAQKGREALQVEWDYGEHADLSTAGIQRQFREAADSGEAVSARGEGDIRQALSSAARTVEAEYEVPFLAHACMEPMNCTARIEEGICEVWVPTQDQSSTQQVAAEVSGVDPDRVYVHTTYLGGGFGRRSHTDFVADAVETAKKAKAPVKVIWTREDSTRHDRYRPATYNRLAATLDSSGAVTGWKHRIAGPSIMAYNGMLQEDQKLDPSSLEVAQDVPYAVPNIHVDYAMSNTPVPLWWWRSVGASQNGFIREAFFDEVAAAAGADPFELRRRLLRDHPRHLHVLELAAEKAGWGSPLAEGRSRGIAVVHSFGSYCAEVAEVSVGADKAVRVHRVDVAIDCGQRVNPEIIAEQMESGVAYGLSAALQEAVTVQRGQVQQSNFDDYPILRMDQMPEVHVHMVESDQDPGGIGEPGTPPIAPALANAVFAATGDPVRRLPLTRSGYRPA
ncbi:xanthine dehydrogenase family protein molybdopterin-binding subunit [Thiohalorhabdus sp. Cl-TMA]|uniref:Molybdopterin cofactor-binding domain-containing protein n=1 Tax=Thiohalorhabdus methylotrophus TaxID=3242694 RepID=A0ABV4TYM9_9GAMM